MKKFVCFLVAAVIFFSPYTASVSRAQDSGGGGGGRGGDYGDYIDRLEEYDDQDEFFRHVNAQRRADLLMSNRSHINERDADKYSALELAAELGDVDVVKVLLNKGADVNARDDEGWTPLMSAARFSPEVVSVLLEAGANVNAKSDYGWTPLIFAVRDGKSEAVSMLLEAGANVNAKNDDGQTPLIVAVIYNYGLDDDNEGLVQLLLDKGADAKIPDNAWKRAIDYVSPPDNSDSIAVVRTYSKLARASR